MDNLSLSSIHNVEDTDTVSLFNPIMLRNRIGIGTLKVLESFTMNLLLCHHVEASFQMKSFKYNEQKTAFSNFLGSVRTHKKQKLLFCVRSELYFLKF